MVDPSVHSSWCSVLELGDARARLCSKFQDSGVAATISAPTPPFQMPKRSHIDAWAAICASLEASLGSKQIGWLANTRVASLDGNLLTVAVPDELTCSWIVGRLMPAIRRTMAEHAYDALEVEFLIDSASFTGSSPSGVPEQPPYAGRGQSTSSPPRAESFIRSPYTFDGFVVAESNRLAHASALAVAEGVGSYTPLLIQGEVGVGKTHLLSAIEGRALERGSVALYTSAENFTNELISAIRSGKVDAFRNRFRRVEVLLVDDCHFIAGKQSTQEEFLHTFDWLHEHGRQVVLTCDLEPESMPGLDRRLGSRLGSGLLAHIEPPDYETKVRIVKRKAALKNRELSDDVAEFLATRDRSSTRKVEGALNALLATADLRGVKPSLELATQIFHDRTDVRSSREPESIVQAVASRFGVSRETLVGRQRSRQASHARHVAMYLLREAGTLSLTDIGRLMGNRDHSTIIYGCERIQRALTDGDSGLRADVEKMRAILRIAS
jgi:chromosomal replication initiator protein